MSEQGGDTAFNFWREAKLREGRSGRHWVEGHREINAYGLVFWVRPHWSDDPRPRRDKFYPRKHR